MKNRLTRRSLLAGGAALVALAPVGAFGQATDAMARGFVNAADFGVLPSADVPGPDLSSKMREAVGVASAMGLPLFVPGGIYAMNLVAIPSATTVYGVRGATKLVSRTDQPILVCYAANDVVLRDLSLDGLGLSGGDLDNPGLLGANLCENLRLEGLSLANGVGAGVHIQFSSGRITELVVDGFSDGIFALDSTGLEISSNRVRNCANGGIRVWSSNEGGAQDGTLVSGNDISAIRSGGGNGQNGNGINVYRANGVRVIGNRMRGCDFSAIRLNTTNDTIVSGNTCLDSGEVAIFSEFAFSGSVIADNIIDGAAQGISMTNFDSGGRLATCTGNIVRNIAPLSRVNPDTTPVGIFAEADAVIANNAVELVPGLGIGAGWGPYLRDVVVTGNVIRECDIGIGVSVAEGAGAAVVTGNLIASARRAGVAGLAWRDIVTDNLQRDAGSYPRLTISDNTQYTTTVVR
jgi:uncharacterized secreted repeat protein (TIGR03808 family)